MRRTMPILLTTALLTMVTPAASHAGLRTIKVPIDQDTVSAVSLSQDGVEVVQYRMVREVRGTANPLKMGLGGGPAVHVDVANHGQEPKDFSVAAALFDKRGRLVGAGSSGNTGKLDPGETKEMKIVFRDVQQEVRYAAWLYLTLETSR